MPRITPGSAEEFFPATKLPSLKEASADAKNAIFETRYPNCLRRRPPPFVVRFVGEHQQTKRPEWKPSLDQRPFVRERFGRRRHDRSSHSPTSSNIANGSLGETPHSKKPNHRKSRCLPVKPRLCGKPQYRALGATAPDILAPFV